MFGMGEDLQELVDFLSFFTLDSISGTIQVMMMKSHHFLFLPRINQSLSQWATAWNLHGLRSEHGHSPLQLRTSGLQAVLAGVHGDPQLIPSSYFHNTAEVCKY